MFFFQKEKKKKKYTALKVVAIIVGILALIAGGYVLYTKVIKPKLDAKKAAAAIDEEPECSSSARRPQSRLSDPTHKKMPLSAAFFYCSFPSLRACFPLLMFDHMMMMA